MDSDWKTYLRRLRLGRFPMLFLWNSQQEALKAELLGEKSLFISMPTSAGKTRTVELAIFKALKDHPDGSCVYVVPTRALAAEVEESLASRLGPMKLGVSVLYGGYDFSPFEEQILAENRIFVLTPEKLDLLARHDDDFKKKISLIIMDEVQEIGSPTPSPRTLRMELILSRMLYIAEKNKARVICLSAMVSNRDDFAKWISGSPENVAHTEWQPTFKRYGLFQWEQDRGRIWYPPLKDEFPTEDFYVPLLFAKRDLSDEDKGRFEVAARVSAFYSKTGPTLVFTTSKPFVDKIVDKITEIFQSNPPDMTDKRDQIARRCAEILGEHHKLVKSIRLGFCYHHADVPRSIRRLLERAIKDATLPLIVSTTTLAQGVNLPIKNVIVHTLSFGGYISTTQFWNAAGRAGRAGYETEGHVVFCYRPDLERIVTSELEKSESFVASGIRRLIESRLPSAETEQEFIAQWALASTSQFRKHWETYESWGPTKRHNAELNRDQILAILDPQLLAWALEESVDEIDDAVVEKWIGKTLFAVQTLDIPEYLEKFKAGLKNRVLAVKGLVPDAETRKLYNRTGLSIASNVKAKEAAKRIKPTLSKLEDANRLPREFWFEIHNAMKDISEVSELARLESKLLADWVDGAEYQKLADEYYGGNIERAAKEIEAATFSFPWGLHAIVQHLNVLTAADAIPSLVTNSPSLIFHGVPTMAAVYAVNLGVYDRQLAIKIADMYLEKHGSTSFGQMKDWLQGIDYPSWVEMLKGNNQNAVDDCYERIKTKKSTEQSEVVLEFNLSDLQPTEKIGDEDLIVVKYKEDYWLCTYDYRRIGKLTGANLSRLHDVDRRNRDLIVEDFDKTRSGVSIRVL
jgi:superfamily II DNA/RNA helicase